MQFLGGCLMALGALMATLCGLCTAGFMFAAFKSSGGQPLGILTMVIGGVPTVAGVVLLIVGWGMIRDARAPLPAPKDLDETPP